MKSGRDVSSAMAAVVLRFIVAIIMVVLVLSLGACAGMPIPMCPEITVKICPVQG